MTRVPTTNVAAELYLENERLQAELHARLEELRGCRRRLVDAIDAERRRLERDLHDATQGRLVSLAMALGLLEARLPSDADAVRPIAREARKAVAAALAELRDLSQGIYPAVLAERGLEPALTELCERAALPACLTVSLDQRPIREVEAAAYFVASESLTNALKHASAHQLHITVRSIRGRLMIKVSDDGIGGASVDRGSGLRGLIDRVEALGGRLSVSSPQGRGTNVWADIPCRTDERAERL